MDKVTTAPSEKLHPYFQQIKSSGNLLLTLLNDVLNLAKLAVGKTHFEWRAADLNLLVGAVVEESSRRVFCLSRNGPKKFPGG